MHITRSLLLASLLALTFASCAEENEPLRYPAQPAEVPTPHLAPELPPAPVTPDAQDTPPSGDVTPSDSPLPRSLTRYEDAEGQVAYIPAGFRVSEQPSERSLRTGLVVLAPDGSEYVWVPTTTTRLEQREFGRYYVGTPPVTNFRDETHLRPYQEMLASVQRYGGFYIGRYEASQGERTPAGQVLPASKRITSATAGRIWVAFSPQRATGACELLYADNPTVQGFFPWGINWDTMLQWLIDSGGKTYEEVVTNSTSWGNYSNDPFSPRAGGQLTGRYEEARANNIYDLAGNNWEWTQERYGSDGRYVLRGGGYNLMGGACEGDRYPAALRNALPGNDYHPNVCFRVGLFVKE